MNMTHVSALLSHSEVVQLAATLLDADGNRCIHASTLLHVQVTGELLKPCSCEIFYQADGSADIRLIP